MIKPKQIDCKEKDISEKALVVYKEILNCEVNEGVELVFNDKTLKFLRIK